MNVSDTEPGVGEQDAARSPRDGNGHVHWLGDS